MTFDTFPAALLIANSRHMEEVKEHLGHSSIRVTSDRYGPLFPSARKALADSLERTFQGGCLGSDGRSSKSCLRPTTFRRRKIALTR